MEDLHEKKVRLDVSNPLKKEQKVKKAGGEWCIVSFKYERLGIYCFLCGLLGHSEKYCARIFDMVEDDGTRYWGPELRVDSRRGGGAGGSKWLREEPKKTGAVNADRGNPVNSGYGNFRDQGHNQHGANIRTNLSRAIIAPANANWNIGDNIPINPSRTITTMVNANLNIEEEGNENPEDQGERKRSLTGVLLHSHAMDHVNSNSGTQHPHSTGKNKNVVPFLTAGSGSQTCREP